MRCIRHAFGILGLAAGALFPVGGLIGLIGLAAGWDGDPDLGRSGMAVVSAAYLCIALVFGAIGIGVWPRRRR